MFKTVKNGVVGFVKRGQTKVQTAGINMLSRSRSFVNSERGDAVNWVVTIFIGLMLMIGVYLLFKGQIDSFVKESIFGKMNQLN